ncbi:hypothetical protein Tco_0829845 [Tanacetum coccineum]
MQAFIVVRLQGHLSFPTPLPESPTQELVNTSHQTPFNQRRSLTTLLTPYNGTKLNTRFFTRKGKGLLGPNDGSGVKFEGGFGGSYGGKGGRGGSIAGRGGGSLAKRSMESKEGLGGGGFVVLEGRSSRESKKACVGTSGGEVKGGGIDFGVSKSLLSEIPRVAIGEGGREPFGDDGGAVW